MKILFDVRWQIEFTANAHWTKVVRAKNTIKHLPLTEDVSKLSEYLRKEIETSKTALTEEKNVKAYDRLQKVLLALIILFNRRRSGEVERMTISEYVWFNSDSSKRSYAK